MTQVPEQVPATWESAEAGDTIGQVRDDRPNADDFVDVEAVGNGWAIRIWTQDGTMVPLEVRTSRYSAIAIANDIKSTLRTWGAFK